MAYVKVHEDWGYSTDCCGGGPDAGQPDTPIRHTDLEHIEDGIFDAAADADQALLDAAAAQTSANAAQTSANAAQTSANAAQTSANAAQTDATAALNGLATKVSKNELVFNVKDYGAVGNGTTDDSTAIQSAINAANAAGGGVVWFPPGVYACAARIKPLSKVTMRGAGGAVIKATASMVYLCRADAATTQWRVENLTFDGNGLITSEILEVRDDSTDTIIRACTLTGTGTEPIGIETRAGVKNLVIEDCVFGPMLRPIRINKNPVNVTIRRNYFSGWIESGIQVLGDATTAASKVWITHNHIDPHGAGGQARQPIQFNGVDSNPFKDVHVDYNTVIGIGTSWTDTTTPGTADLISLHRCDGFTVIGNRVINGGDTGITIAQQCRRGVISGNVATNNDTVGISVGSGTSSFCDHLAITGNTFMDNGQARIGGRSDTVRAGMILQNAHHVVVDANNVGDTQVTPTQKYGMSFVSATNIQVGDYLADGVGIAPVYGGTGLANIQSGKSIVGTGSPEGVVTALPGARYTRTDGTTVEYVKQAGYGSTGWVAASSGGTGGTAAWAGGYLPAADLQAANGATVVTTNQIAAIQHPQAGTTRSLGMVWIPTGVTAVNMIADWAPAGSAGGDIVLRGDFAAAPLGSVLPALGSAGNVGANTTIPHPTTALQLTSTMLRSGLAVTGGQWYVFEVVRLGDTATDTATDATNVYAIRIIPA